MSDEMPEPGERWTERDAGGVSWRVTSIDDIHPGPVKAVNLSGPGPCRGMTCIPLTAFLAKWKRMPPADPEKVWPIVCSGYDTVNGHHVPRVAWEVYTPTTEAGLARMARALLETGAILTSSYPMGFGAHKLGRGVSAVWLIFIPRGSEAKFDATAKPEERKRPSRVSVGMAKMCETSEPRQTEVLRCECGERIIRDDFVSGEWIGEWSADGEHPGHWQDDGKAWAQACESFRDRHSREAHRTELQQRRLVLDSKHIPDDLAWLVYTTAEEGHGGVLLFWKRGGSGEGAGYTTRLDEAGRWREPEARRLGKGPRDRQADPRYTPGDHAIRYLDAVSVARRVVPLGALPKPEGARW